jgi:excisionase family DNA binding protein
MTGPQRCSRHQGGAHHPPCPECDALAGRILKVVDTPRPVSRIEAVVAGPVARWVGRSLVRDIGNQYRQHNQRPPRWAQEVLDALAQAVESPSTAGGFASATAPATLEAHRITVPAAARETGLSEQYIRRLAKSGRIRARRAGRDWQIDLESLRDVSRKRDAA